MGCCSISPTHDGFKIELNDSFKQLIEKKNTNNDNIYRRFNYQIEEENNRPQLINVLGRRLSVSPLKQSSRLHIQDRLNTMENTIYWKPNPSTQNRISVSPLNRSGKVKEDYNQIINQRLKTINNNNNSSNLQGISQPSRSHSAINSLRNSQTLKQTQVSPLQISPMNSRVQQQQRQILVINDFNCSTSTIIPPKQPLLSSSNTNIWNQISSEINQFTSKKNKDKIKITLNGDRCTEFAHSDKLLCQLTPQLASQGIIVDSQNIQFKNNDQGKQQLEVELKIHKQTNQDNTPNIHNLQKEGLQIQDFTLQQSQNNCFLKYLRQIKFNNTRILRVGLKVPVKVPKDQVRFIQSKKKNNIQINVNKEQKNIVDEQVQYKGSPDSQKSLYEYKKTSSRLSTNNNSRVDIINSQANSNSGTSSIQHPSHANLIYCQQSSQDSKQQKLNDCQLINQDQFQLSQQQKILQENGQSIRELTEQLIAQENQSQKVIDLNKSKLNNMNPDEYDLNSKICNFSVEDSLIKNDYQDVEINSQKQNNEKKQIIAFSESIKKCQEIKKYLQYKLNNENNSVIQESQDNSLKQSRSSFKDSKSRKANLILQEIQDMIQNSSLTYQSHNNLNKPNQSIQKCILENNDSHHNGSSFNSSQFSQKKESAKINQLLNKLDKLNQSYKNLNHQIENEIQNSKNSSLASLQQDNSKI